MGFNSRSLCERERYFMISVFDLRFVIYYHYTHITIIIITIIIILLLLFFIFICIHVCVCVYYIYIPVYIFYHWAGVVFFLFVLLFIIIIFFCTAPETLAVRATARRCRPRRGRSVYLRAACSFSIYQNV